jgi:hypothetical protein
MKVLPRIVEWTLGSFDPNTTGKKQMAVIMDPGSNLGSTIYCH